MAKKTLKRKPVATKHTKSATTTSAPIVYPAPAPLSEKIENYIISEPTTDNLLKYSIANNRFQVPVQIPYAKQVPYGQELSDDVLLRQIYAESAFNPNAVSSAGYKGLGQIGEDVIEEYKKATGAKNVDPFNINDNLAVQKWAMTNLYNADFINKPDQDPEIRLAKALAGYNWGRGHLSDYLSEQKKKGVDIYNSKDWMNDLPTETREYIEKILYKSNDRFNDEFKKAIGNNKYKNITERFIYDPNKVVIDDNMGQWAHPGEVTRIASNDITMQGVPYPVLGVGADGEQRMMYPNEEHTFNEAPVTEYPMMQAKDGGWLTRYQDGSTVSTDDEKYTKFVQTLPDNLKNNDDRYYNLRGYWESLGKPEAFDYSQPKEEDGYYHAFSRNPNTGEILKKPGHPTFKYALEEDAKEGYNAYISPDGTVYTFGKDDVIPEGFKPYEYKRGGVTWLNEYAEGGWLDNLYSTMNPYNWGVNDYSSNKEYSQAYAAAKKAGEEEFIWNGKRFNTKYAGTPRQEVGTYGINGKPVNKEDLNYPALTSVYPMLSKHYIPGHIASSLFDIGFAPAVSYGPKGNSGRKIGEMDDARGSGEKSYYSYGVNRNTFENVSSELNNKHDWNLFTNNCADNVCDAFGISRSPLIETPENTMKKISKKYPSKEVTGRTDKDYWDMISALDNSSASKVLSQADNLLGLSYSPDFKENGLSGSFISQIQKALYKEGYELPKSTIVGAGYVKYDGKFGPETKEALEDWKKKHAVKHKYGGRIFSAGGEKHKVYRKQSPTGNGKGVKGHIMVTHPTEDKGKWDTIDLTEKSGAKTVAQGVAATRKWHKENPEYQQGGPTTRYSYVLDDDSGNTVFDDNGNPIIINPTTNYTVPEWLPQVNITATKLPKPGGIPTSNTSQSNGSLAADIALDAAQFVPGPLGTAASVVGMGKNLYEGDYVGAGLDLANIATAGGAKWLTLAADFAKAAGKANKGSRLAKQAKLLEHASNPNLWRATGLTRDLLKVDVTGYTPIYKNEPGKAPDLITNPEISKRIKNAKALKGIYK